jgi:hypothetical protein
LTEKSSLHFDTFGLGNTGFPHIWYKNVPSTPTKIPIQNVIIITAIRFITSPPFSRAPMQTQESQYTKQNKRQSNTKISRLVLSEILTTQTQK